MSEKMENSPNYLIEEDRDILVSVTFDGTIRAYSYEDMLKSRETLPLRIVCQELHGAQYLDISKFNPELMVIITPKELLVSLIFEPWLFNVWLF